jgi:DNA-binding MarR family transcriptional regulator
MAASGVVSGSQATGLSEEAIARRYARRFPGYRLADYGRVALPPFRMQVRVLKITRKKLPILHEFILRTINVGLTHAGDIAGFLGLERTLVNTALTELATNGQVILAGAEGQRAHRLALTEQGRGALDSMTLEKLEEDIEVVWLDGLTRRLTAEIVFLQQDEVAKQGLTEISPYPRRNPDVEDFRGDLFREWKHKHPDFELIAILRVERIQHVFRDDVLLLTYAHDGEADHTSHKAQVGFVVGGHWSDDHAEAFRTSNADSCIPLVAEQVGNAVECSTLLEPRLAALITPNEDVSALREQTTVANQRIDAFNEQLRTTNSASQRRVLMQHLLFEQERRAQAEAQLSNIRVRLLDTYEHPPLLNDALSNAKERILIVSPWVRSGVVNESFVRKLEKALRRSVFVYVGYGIGRDDESGQDNAAVDALKRLEDRYDNLFLRNLGNTHAKILVCDSRYVVITSFNWLSFRSDQRREFRDERGFYAGIQSYIEETFDSYLSQFQGG